MQSIKRLPCVTATLLLLVLTSFANSPVAAQAFNENDANGSPAACSQQRILSAIAASLTRIKHSDTSFQYVEDSVRGQRTDAGANCTAIFTTDVKSTTVDQMTYALKVTEGKLNINLLTDETIPADSSTRLIERSPSPVPKAPYQVKICSNPDVVNIFKSVVNAKAFVDYLQIFDIAERFNSRDNNYDCVFSFKAARKLYIANLSAKDLQASLYLFLGLDTGLTSREKAEADSGLQSINDQNRGEFQKLRALFIESGNAVVTIIPFYATDGTILRFSWTLKMIAFDGG